jgi:hypothetical protein
MWRLGDRTIPPSLCSEMSPEPRCISAGHAPSFLQEACGSFWHYKSSVWHIWAPDRQHLTFLTFTRELARLLCKSFGSRESLRTNNGRMGSVTVDRDYYRRRIEEETSRGAREHNPEVRHVHETLADLYRSRLDRETPRAEHLTYYSR